MGSGSVRLPPACPCTIDRSHGACGVLRCFPGALSGPTPDNTAQSAPQAMAQAIAQSSRTETPPKPRAGSWKRPRPKPQGKGRKPAPCAVVLDFDLTIMSVHCWERFREAPLAKVTLRDHMFGDRAFLQWLFPALAQQGVLLCIATFGRQDVALKVSRSQPVVRETHRPWPSEC